MNRLVRRFYHSAGCFSDFATFFLDQMNTLSLFIVILLCWIPSVFGYCSQDSDCLHGGECNKNKCECSAIRWAGEHCEIRTEAYLGRRYDIYFYIILVTCWIICIACAVKLWFVYQVSKKFSMVHLALWMITIAMFLRGVNYVTEADGHYYRNDSLEPFSGLCFYLFYPLVLSAYLCELFLWMELYQATAQTRIENLPRYRKIFIAANSFMFPLELVTRIVLAIFKDTTTGVIFIGIYACYIGMVMLLETIGFVAMSILVLKRLSQVKAITGHEQARKTFMQVSFVLNGLALLLILGLATVLYYFLATNIEVYYGLLWFSRAVEFSVATGLMLVIRAPRSEHSSSYEMSDSKGSGTRLSRNQTQTIDIDLVQ